MCVYQHQDHLFALLMVVPGKRPHSSRILEAASQHIVHYIAEVAGEAAAASCLLHYTTTTVVQSTTTTTTSGGGITAAIHYALIFSSAIVVQFHNSVRHRLLLGSRGQQSSCIVLETVCTIVDGADTHHHTHTHSHNLLVLYNSHMRPQKRRQKRSQQQQQPLQRLLCGG